MAVTLSRSVLVASYRQEWLGQQAGRPDRAAHSRVHARVRSKIAACVYLATVSMAMISRAGPVIALLAFRNCHVLAVWLGTPSPQNCAAHQTDYY